MATARVPQCVRPHRTALLSCKRCAPTVRWLPDETLIQIASENNLSETAFVVSYGKRSNYHIRWFTPTVEVNCCGHATLATGPY